MNNISHTEEFEELCAGYVLHALEEEERLKFEQMLAEASDKERMLYQELWSAAHQLAFTIEEQEPSEDLKERLMAQIRAEAEELNQKNAKTDRTKVTSIDDDRSASTEEGQKRTNWTAFAAAASFVLLIVSLSLIFYSFNLNSQISENESVIKDQKTQINELKNNLDRREEMLSILEARDLDVVLMSGLDVNPNGYGKVMWDPNKQQALLQVSNLPPVPNDKDYQLWIIKDNKPVSAGVFAVNNSEDKFFKIEQMAKAKKQASNAFAVTMEPKGGVTQPTGDMYLLGNVE